MRYYMLDWLGRQVGNTEESVEPLVEMARKLNETDDMVIWAVGADLVRRVHAIVGQTPGIITTFYRV